MGRIGRRDLNQGPGQGISKDFDSSQALRPGSGPANAIRPKGNKQTKHGDVKVLVRDGVEQTDVTLSPERRSEKPVNMRTVCRNVTTLLSCVEATLPIYEDDCKKFSKSLALLCEFIDPADFHKRKLSIPQNAQWPKPLSKLTEAGIDPLLFLTDIKYNARHMTPDIRKALSEFIDPIALRIETRLDILDGIYSAEDIKTLLKADEEADKKDKLGLDLK